MNLEVYVQYNSNINSGIGFGDPKGFEVTCEANTICNTKELVLFGTSDPTKHN